MGNVQTTERDNPSPFPKIYNLCQVLELALKNPEELCPWHTSQLQPSTRYLQMYQVATDDGEDCS